VGRDGDGRRQWLTVLLGHLVGGNRTVGEERRWPVGGNFGGNAFCSCYVAAQWSGGLVSGQRWRARESSTVAGSRWG
jgi:hypothetical protein